MTTFVTPYTLMLFESRVLRKRLGAKILTPVQSLKTSFVGGVLAILASSLVESSFQRKSQ